MAAGHATRRAVPLLNDHAAVGGLGRRGHGSLLGADRRDDVDPLTQRLTADAIEALAGPRFGDAFGEDSRCNSTAGRGNGIKDAIAQGLVALGKMLLGL